MLKRGSTDVDARDRGYAGRLAVAFALALALHEVIAGFLSRRAADAPRERVVARQIVSITHRPMPTPLPTPAPQPTPRRTPAPHYTLAPTVVVKAPAPKAAATPHGAIGGAAAHRHVAHRTVAARPAPPLSLAEGTHAGQQNGGAGTGAGAGIGTGGLGGTGTGTAGQGAGNGGDTNGAPCGEVYLLPANVSYRPDGTVVQEVLAKVVLHDGTVEIGRFPYPFTYAAERLNPFRHDDAAPNNATPVQAPPAGIDVSSAPVAVQVVLKYTNPATGRTTLPECQDPSPTP